MKVGVVGTGALGSHHVRILSELPGAELVGVFDIRSEVARSVAHKYQTTPYSSLERLAQEVEAVVLAVPTVSHCEVGCELLARGLHLLVEKPMATSLAEADRLRQAAGDLVLAVGHVEFYNPAVQALLELKSKPRYVVVERLGVFSRRSLDVDVILDLMIHDLQILHALDGSEVAEIRAIGINVLSPRIDIANVRLELASGCVANLTASRVSAERVRRLRVFLPIGYYSLDYQEQKIKGYRLAEETASRQAAPLRSILADEVAVAPCEPLRRELENFIAKCGGASVPVVDAAQGRRALATALAVVSSISSKLEVDSS